MNTFRSPLFRQMLFLGWLVPTVIYGQSNGAHAGYQQRFKSGPTQVDLIELYSSEGCRSCPPADRWLSQLKSHPGLWQDLVPVAFHVDYWNYLGWRDRFARPEYSQRQRRYAREHGESTVYTPGLRWNGDEWRDWRRATTPESRTVRAPGVLHLDVLTAGQFDAQFNASHAQSAEQSRTLTVAILGMDLVSNVARGENRGRVLRHDFVVLGLRRFAEQGAGKWSGEFPRPDQAASRYALVAWVTQGNRLTPLQATGGYLNQDLLSE